MWRLHEHATKTRNRTARALSQADQLREARRAAPEGLSVFHAVSRRSWLERGLHDAGVHHHGRERIRKIGPDRDHRRSGCYDETGCGNPSWIGSSTSMEGASVISCVAFPRPGAKGTVSVTPAAAVACSTPTFPPRTITSSTLARRAPRSAPAPKGRGPAGRPLRDLVQPAAPRSAFDRPYEPRTDRICTQAFRWVRATVRHPASDHSGRSSMGRQNRSCATVGPEKR